MASARRAGLRNSTGVPTASIHPKLCEHSKPHPRRAQWELMGLRRTDPLLPARAIMLLDVESGNMISSRREVFQLTGAGLASAAALSIAERAPAQVPEDADSPSVTIVRKGINKELDIVNIDLLQAAAKQVLPKGVFVFIANGNGEQWTLRENRRAFGDYALSPHRMSRIARDRIDTSITLLGKKLNLTEDFCS